jgi:hypothetical protein
MEQSFKKRRHPAVKAPPDVRDRCVEDELLSSVSDLAVVTPLPIAQAGLKSASLPPLGGSGAIRSLTRLQEVAGNDAVQRLVQQHHHHVGPGRQQLQRQPYPTVPTEGRPMGPGDQGQKEQEFRDAMGDKLVSALKGALSGWAGFRSNPRSGNPKAMPGLKEASSALDNYEAPTRGGTIDDRWPEAWMKDYASAQLGPQLLVYLGEMASIDPIFPQKVGRLFNVERKKVTHTYELNMAASTTMTDTVVGSLVPTVHIKCSNTLGWSWAADYMLVGAMVGVGVEVGAEFGDEQDEQKRSEQHADQIVKNPNPWWWPFGGGNPFKQPRIPRPTFNKPKVKSGTNVGQLKISLEGKALAEPPGYFWGPDDVSGACRYAELGGTKIESPIYNGSVGFGALLEFTEGWAPVPLRFPLDMTTKSETKLKVKGKISFSLKGPAVGGGGAILKADPVYGEPPPTGKPQVVDDQRVWKWQAGPFKTGSQDASHLGGKLDPLVNQVVSELDVGSQIVDLEKAGIDPRANFALEIEVVGYASRRWEDARTEAARLENNETLAVQRAQAIGSLLQDRLGGFNTTVIAVGGALGGDRGGPAAVISTEVLDATGRPTGRMRQVMAKDAEAEIYFKQHKAQLDGQLARGEISKEVYDDELAYLIRTASRKSDDERARKVEIKVTWKGKRVAFELPAASGAAKP